jgi:ABC-type dipeptide/oligopeptide/nickel transport system permease component
MRSVQKLAVTAAAATVLFAVPAGAASAIGPGRIADQGRGGGDPGGVGAEGIVAS